MARVWGPNVWSPRGARLGNPCYIWVYDDGEYNYVVHRTRESREEYERRYIWDEKIGHYYGYYRPLYRINVRFRERG